MRAAVPFLGLTGILMEGPGWSFTQRTSTEFSYGGPTLGFHTACPDRVFTQKLTSKSYFIAVFIPWASAGPPGGWPSRQPRPGPQSAAPTGRLVGRRQPGFIGQGSSGSQSGEPGWDFIQRAQLLGLQLGPGGWDLRASAYDEPRPGPQSAGPEQTFHDGLWPGFHTIEPGWALTPWSWLGFYAAGCQ